MRVSFVTNISPEITIYDSRNPEPGMLAKIFSPVVFIRDDSGSVLYSYGEYKTNDFLPWLIMGIVALFAFKLLAKGKTG